MAVGGLDKNTVGGFSAAAKHRFWVEVLHGRGGDLPPRRAQSLRERRREDQGKNAAHAFGGELFQAAAI
jgi:hypothetical protein